MRTFAITPEHGGAAVLPYATPQPPAVSAALRSELEATALRAAAANGFGDAGPASDGRVEPPLNAGLAELVRARAQALLQHLRDARRVRAERLALAQIDSATLRDLGLEAADPHRLYAALEGSAA